MKKYQNFLSDFFLFFGGKIFSIIEICILSKCFLTCAPNEHSKSACAFAQSDQSRRCPHEENLHPRLSEMR